jgi:glutathione S-transferase
MSKTVLYFAPGACSRVTTTALEEIGLDFEDRPINIFIGEQRSPDYLAINPNGKVPALLVDDRVLTENAAILIYLDEAYPKAGLLPDSADLFMRAQSRSDLIWCATTLHPLARTILMPERASPGDPAGARSAASGQLAGAAAVIENRLAQGWWHGQQWSITDVYLAWAMGLAKRGGFELAGFPNIEAHAQRVAGLESFKRAIEREQAAIERYGIQIPPAPSNKH